jgi:hypothetical protein
MLYAQFLHAIACYLLLLHSVRVQNFEVHGQCMIQGPYQWYKDAVFVGRVTGAHIVLTGRQRGINGQ